MTEGKKKVASLFFLVRYVDFVVCVLINLNNLNRYRMNGKVLLN